MNTIIIVLVIVLLVSVGFNFKLTEWYAHSKNKIREIENKNEYIVNENNRLNSIMISKTDEISRLKAELNAERRAKCIFMERANKVWNEGSVFEPSDLEKGSFEMEGYSENV